jgi:hypothetical protein
MALITLGADLQENIFIELTTFLQCISRNSTAVAGVLGPLGAEGTEISSAA